MAIVDGMRTHDEGLGVDRKYRMPDLLNEEEMKIYFAGTYGVGIEIVELSDEMREKATGVGTLAAPSVVGDRDREIFLLRKKLGLDDNDDEDTVKELHSRVMTRSEFADKYGKQPEVRAPEEAEKLEEEQEAERTGESDDPNRSEKIEEDKPSVTTKTSPAEKLNLLTKDQDKK